MYIWIKLNLAFECNRPLIQIISGMNFIQREEKNEWSLFAWMSSWLSLFSSACEYLEKQTRTNLPPLHLSLVVSACLFLKYLNIYEYLSMVSSLGFLRSFFFASSSLFFPIYDDGDSEWVNWTLIWVTFWQEQELDQGKQQS